jgi:hypothetical protein
LLLRGHARKRARCISSYEIRRAPSLDEPRREVSWRDADDEDVTAALFVAMESTADSGQADRLTDGRHADRRQKPKSH